MTRKNDQPDDRPLDEVAAAAEFDGDKGADDGVPVRCGPHRDARARRPGDPRAADPAERGRVLT